MKCLILLLLSVHSNSAYQHHHQHPKYEFNYGVKDPHTGDHKSAWEKRDGDVVKGGYTLKEADGTERIVEYVADSKNGFKALVKKVGHPHSAHYAAPFTHFGHGFGVESRGIFTGTPGFGAGHGFYFA